MIAATFHFDPDKIWDMDARDIEFWVRRVQWVSDSGKT